MQVFQDQVDTDPGHLLVDGHVITSGLQDTQESHHSAGMTVHEDHDGFLGQSFGQQSAADGLAAVSHLGESKSIRFGDTAKGQLIRHTQDRLIQIF